LRQGSSYSCSHVQCPKPPGFSPGTRAVARGLLLFFVPEHHSAAQKNVGMFRNKAPASKWPLCLFRAWFRNTGHGRERPQAHSPCPPHPRPFWGAAPSAPAVSSSPPFSSSAAATWGKRMEEVRASVPMHHSANTHAAPPPCRPTMCTTRGGDLPHPTCIDIPASPWEPGRSPPSRACRGGCSKGNGRCMGYIS